MSLMVQLRISVLFTKLLYTLITSSSNLHCGPIQRFQPRSTYAGFVATKQIRLAHPRFYQDLISDRGKKQKEGRKAKEKQRELSVRGMERYSYCSTSYPVDSEINLRRDWE